MYFSSWNFIKFLQKEPTKVKNFRLSTAQVKFLQACTLIGSFCRKYIKFQLKKYRGVMSHDTEEWCKIWRKTDSVFQKWLWRILIGALKILKNLHFDWCLLCKVYNVWPKKSTEELYFMTLKSHAKFEERLTCGLENDMRNMANFHQNNWKCQTWYFHRILLSKVENTRAKILQRSYVWWQWRMMKNLKKNWLVILKLT